MATAPLRSGFAETSSSRRVLGSPLWDRVGPWPAMRGWTGNLYSSIRSSRSSSVASLPLPRSTPAGVASLSVCTPVRRWPAMWSLVVHRKSVRVAELGRAGAEAAVDVVAVGRREVLSRRGHRVLRLGLQLARPLVHRRRRLLVAAGDRRPVALHHLVGDAAPQHRPALVHEAG